MTTAHDVRHSVTTATPVLALVGATDLVVERMRSAREHHVVQEVVQQAPTRAMNTTIALAARAEETYGDLAARGERLVQRLSTQGATHDLLTHGKVTLSRGRAAVSTVRRMATGAGEAAAQTVRGQVAPAADRPAASGTTEAPVAQPPASQRSQPAKTAAKSTKAKSPRAPRAAKPTAVAPADSTAEVTRAIHEAAEKADN